jgi:hypothetical protein
MEEHPLHVVVRERPGEAHLASSQELPHDSRLCKLSRNNFTEKETFVSSKRQRSLTDTTGGPRVASYGR